MSLGIREIRHGDGLINEQDSESNSPVNIRGHERGGRPTARQRAVAASGEGCPHSAEGVPGGASRRGYGVEGRT